MKPQTRTKTEESRIKKLADECSVGTLTASLLLQRGIEDKASAKKFLYGNIDDLGDPYAYVNMDKIVERLHRAVQNREKIVVYGDYDCDGIGATSIYYLALSKASVPVYYYIPTRKDEGYGLNKGAIEKIKLSYAPDILLTADCGITSHEEVAYAISLGMDVIVTDHHTPTNEPLPCLYTDPCYTPELTQLCAAGVAYFVVRALFGEEESRNYTDICAVSTIADIVPLTVDNRILVKEGLEKIHKGQTRIGLKTLIQYAKCNLRTLSAGDISFRIAPRLNAAGRLSTPIDSLRLIVEDDPVSTSLLAENLSLQNTERQQLSADIFNDAKKQLVGYDFGKYKLIMLCGEWNEGVVGIVCSRLTEYYHLPTILLCKQDKGTLCGSARSIEGVNLYDLLDKNKDFLTTYGGHAMAAGLSLKEENFLAAREAMNHTLQAIDSDVFKRKTLCDAVYSIKDITRALFDELQLFAPFGACNPAPVFYDEKPDFTFKKGSDRIPMIKARTPIGEIVSFDGLGKLPLLQKDNYSILYTVEKNTFNGVETPQFPVKQFFFGDFTKEDEESFFENFLLPDYPKQDKKTHAPTLYVCYLADTVKKLIETLPPDTPVYYKDAPKTEITDSIVLSPSTSFPFYVFGKVVFADITNPRVEKAMLFCGAECVSMTKYVIKSSVNVDYLRKVFVYYMTTRPIFGKFNGFGEYYADDTLGSKSDFLIASYILAECKLLTVDEQGALQVHKKKADPTETMLYKYVKEEL